MPLMFDELLQILSEPLKSNGVKTDNSIMLIYPPEKELDFREYLNDTFLPTLKTRDIPFFLIDLSTFLFETVDGEGLRDAQEYEFDDYVWMKQGLSKKVETDMVKRIDEAASSRPGCAVFLYATSSLYPLVRFGEVLRGLRDLNCRVILSFPGEERGGKLHFMKQADGGNYLSVKLFWR